MQLPERVKMVEVGLRDGLQNEPGTIPTGSKIELINRLAAIGFKAIEVGSFVSPKWVPQMADSGEVLAGITRRPGVHYPVLVPNIQGLDRAIAAGAREIAVFGAASESFSHKNINCSIEASLERFREVVDQARTHDIAVRGYISCVLGCPYEGAIHPDRVASVAKGLWEMGCYEISLGDTIGSGTPLAAQRMVQTVAEGVPPEALAAHFHDTYGQALANILAVMELGVTTIDTAVAGLGGCPYALGASGNVASEDVLYMMDGLGIDSGINLDELIGLGHDISAMLGRRPASKVSLARKR